MPSRYRCVFAGAALLACSSPLSAQTPTLPTVGAGLQTSFVVNSPEEGDSTATFPLNSVRLYVNGTASEGIKYMFNTEYNGSTNAVGILDAAAMLTFSPQVNIWAGRFLPPSDRANLYGPYYSNHWAVYTDGIQDGYPFVATGRDNGAMYWGQFNKVKLSAGAFEASNSDSDVLGAFRAQVDFWDQEDGYYLNGTYYGAKNLLALGVAGQVDQDGTALTADFLLEKKMDGGGVVSVEAEYANYDELGGYDANYLKSDGGYVLGAYLFPTEVGSGVLKGKLQLLGKYAHAAFSEGLTGLNPDYDQNTTEFNFNYIIKEFNARLMFFYKSTSFDDVRQDNNQFGVGLQIQM
jgi:hypothetical protein